jgi:hypothetical protein
MDLSQHDWKSFRNPLNDGNLVFFVRFVGSILVQILKSLDFLQYHYKSSLCYFKVC